MSLAAYYLRARRHDVEHRAALLYALNRSAAALIASFGGRP